MIEIGSSDLWPDESLISWHIPVRCHSGFEGQLPLPKEIVPDADAVTAIIKALHNPSCHVVVLVGEAGTGKTTALEWLVHVLKQDRLDVIGGSFRCSSRTSIELQEFLTQASADNQPKWFIVDALDELRGELLHSLEKLLEPILPCLLDGTIRIVLSVRSELGKRLLVPPAEGLSGTREWGDAWAGVETLSGVRIAILQLQELRRTDVELYAAQRGLGEDFVAHLRSLYDLRELVRRFFLLVKLCDLSEQLAPEEWKQIRARNRLYERLLTIWLTTEGARDPQGLPLLVDDLFTLLEQAVLLIDHWTADSNIPLTLRLGSILNNVGKLELRGADGYVVAAALVNANIVCETGFAHKSIEEYLLARALSNLVRTSQVEVLTPKRITDDVISFLAEDEVFRGWLDQHQDQLTNISPEYLPHLVRLLHRQGRAIPNLELRNAKLDNLQLPGICLRGADLRNANLIGTQLGPADLTDADLRGTLMRQVSVWTAQRVSELYASADGPDRVWLIHPTANFPDGLAVLVQIGTRGGRIVAYQQYDRRSSKLFSDGQWLYRLPKTTQRQKAEIAQWLGENIAVERWWLSPDSLPLASNLLPGAVWQISTNRAILYNDDVELKVFSHPNSHVRGTLGVSQTSTFAHHQLDGFYLTGSKLWVVGLHMHALISEGLTSTEPLQRVAAVGEMCIVFKVGTTWQTWAPHNKETVVHPELADVSRITALPTGGFALVRPTTVEFVDENFNERSSQLVTISMEAYLAGIKRGSKKAILVKDYQGLCLIDEKSGLETLNWLNLRAARARFDQHTELSNDLRAALTAAAARDESFISTAPSIENIMTITSPSAQSTFDVLLITVNQHEFDAVYTLAQQRLGKEPNRVPKLKRIYYDLGRVGDLRVGMVRSQMGSTQPGATTTTTLQAMREVCPHYLIVVGIAFGVDPDKQSIGQILYSEKLQDYNLIKASTDKYTKELIIIPRGDKVSPNPTFLNRVQSVADIWRMREQDIPISPALLLSGDTLVDNFDYREQLLELFPEALGGEMEATGVYSASREDETPWMIIKAICDYADGNKRENKEVRQKQAANNAAQFVFYLIEQGNLTLSKID